MRFAFRQWGKNPAFALLAAITLALGIGGTVGLFSVVHGLLIRPLPIVDEERVVAFWSEYNWRGEEYDLVKEVAPGFETVAAFSNEGYTLRSEQGGSLVLATVASAELWDVLGTPPMMGRTFVAGEDRPGSEAVTVLTHGLWQREFGADPEIVGSRIDLDGVPHTVIGVMPEGFYFPSPEMELFVPLDLDPADPGYAGNGWLVLAGRMAPGVRIDGLADDLAAITRVLDERYDYPARWDKTQNASVEPMREYLLGDVRPAMLLLLGAVGLLLLMACVNVAALILTKTVDRGREMSVRAALGAGRLRLARQILTESVLLGVVAGALGVALATALFDVLVASLPIDRAFGETLSLDWRALFSALLLSVVTGSLIALAPMRNLLRGRLAEGALTQRGTGVGSASRMQNALVVAEVLLAVVLVTGASLLVRTVGELRSLETGFDPRGVMSAGILISEEESTPDERRIFFEEMAERVAALPGVTATGYINRLPLRDGGWQGPVSIDGRPDLEGANRPNALYRPVSAGTFETLGIAVLEGRPFEATDHAEAPRVAIVNETFARQIWGEEGALGRTFSTGFTGEVRVVGVVEDIAVQDLVSAPPMTAYYPWGQAMAEASFGILLAKTDGDPAALAGPIRALTAELAPRAVLGRLEPFEDAVDAAMAEPLRLRFFLGLFSVLGVVLGTVGIYGVVSYSVERRRAEFGIRMALGAEPGLLLGSVVRRGLIPVVGGIVAGSLVAYWASRVLTNFLFEVEPTDPLSFVAAGGVLLLSGVVAAVIPAARASGTDPATALRSD